MTASKPSEGTLSLLNLPHRSQGIGPQQCGEFAIRIGRDGTWYYLNSPIGRKPLVKLFSTVLRRESDGHYWLVTPYERGRIEVEDVPFIAVEVTAEGTGPGRRLRFRTNLDDEVVADKDHPIRVVQHPDTDEPTPYIMIRDGLEARLTRPVFYELVELGESRRQDGEEQLGVWSGGQFFLLGRTEAQA
ncbi:hypothetical protein FRZ61_09250 [Hypericibacter adhaerens]|uniref:Proteophosphoglycan n=1 Tax=Hypericibacter adhaerens TaxID=2602016 RepID=A0A5J6MWC9_9PROT|nr:DUF1285 domain-containing protein [Hypericibacter adhaerens]QEX21005.1 hypothetical protein FRZ61_09250 [Hypericibacter adhaerens]